VNRSAWWLGLALLLWSTSFNLTLPFLPLVAEARGATPWQVGLVQGVAFVGAALALIPGGLLADRIGFRLTLLAGWGIGGAGALLLWRGESWQALLPGAFFLLAGAGASPALAALSAALARAGSLRRSVSLVFAAAPGGLLLGSAGAGLISERWGMAALFPAATLVTVVAMLVLLRVPDPQPEHRAHPAGPKAAAPHTSNFVKLMVLAVPAGIGYLLLSLPGTFLTPYLRDVLHLSLTGTGLTSAVLAIGQLGWSALFAAWPGDLGTVDAGVGRMRLRLSRGTLLALTVCLGANALYGFLLPVAGSAFMAAAVLILRGALVSLQPLGLALVSETTGTGAGLAGRFSVLALIMSLSTSVSPVLAGALYTAHPAYPFYVAGLAAALGALALTFLGLTGRQ